MLLVIVYKYSRFKSKNDKIWELGHRLIPLEIAPDEGDMRDAWLGLKAKLEQTISHVTDVELVYYGLDSAK